MIKQERAAGTWVLVVGVTGEEWLAEGQVDFGG